MRTGVLFSGGKDSVLALYQAKQFEEVNCLITIESENPDSFMFHTPNIQLTKLQSKALGLPLVYVKTKGEKEKELKELENAIRIAKKAYGLDGIVTGAIASVYQATRIQRICNKLKLSCFNPLWLKCQFEILEELIKLKFKVLITGVFGDGLQSLIGKQLDNKLLAELRRANENFRINPAGEGGEFESFVLDMPLFRKKIVIQKFELLELSEYSRLIEIKRARLEPK